MQNDQDETGKPKGSGVEGSPMAMGMAMAKKMMAQIGQGNRPHGDDAEDDGSDERARRQAADGEDDGMCMGMCSEAIRQTNAAAVFATPELQRTFADWLKEIEGKAEALLADSRRMRQRSPALKISEESVTYILARLAMRGKITLGGRYEYERVNRR